MSVRKRPQFTTAERQFLVSSYERHHNANNKYVRVIQEFADKYPDQRIPDRKTIYALVKKWQNDHTVHNVNKGRSGRKPSVNTPENQERVKAQLDADAALPADAPNITSAKRNDLGNHWHEHTL